MGWFQVSFTPAIPARDAGEDAGQAETAPDAALAPKSFNSNVYILKVQTKLPLKSSHNSLCCYTYVLQNVTLAQDVYHRALQGYIAHAEASSVDKATEQRILAFSLQITM